MQTQRFVAELMFSSKIVLLSWWFVCVLTCNRKMETIRHNHRHICYEKFQLSILLIHLCLSIYLGTAGSNVDPTGLPQIADVPHSLTNGNHAVPSIAQPPLNQSGPGRPTATGTDCADFSSIIQLISRKKCISCMTCHLNICYLMCMLCLCRKSRNSFASPYVFHILQYYTQNIKSLY